MRVVVAQRERQEVEHNGYRSAFDLALHGYFTRRVPEVMRRFAAADGPVFHDYVLHGNPSHTGVDGLESCHPAALRARLILYHYKSEVAATQLRAMGHRVAKAGSR